MTEACPTGNSPTTSSVPITTEDLTIRGLDIQIRNERANGTVLAERLGARYTTRLARLALCSGLKFDKLRDLGSGITTFAYFLDARSQ